jgi:ferritin-like metal-binding protein YciE
METNSSIATLHNLLDYNAGKFTSGEIQLKKNLHDWVNKTSSLQLKQVLQKYLNQVIEHVKKMEPFFIDEKFTSLSVINGAMQVLIEETNEQLSLCSDAEVADACMLASIQTINHYKISTYGTAAAFADNLGLEQFAAIFHEMEINEKNIDDRLSQLAKYEINKKAEAPTLLPGGS